MSISQVRQNFHEENEAGINKQINTELYASYVYQAMSFHFDRDDIALKGFSKFFKKQSDEEREHAEKLMAYQNKRGGRIVLKDVAAPEKTAWESGLEAFQDALELEKTVNQALLGLHEVASANKDPQFSDFIEGEFLKEQVNSIKELGDHISNLKKAGPGLGEYLYSKESLE